MATKPLTTAGTTDHYRLLEVDARASPEVIHAAYRALMKEYAPRTAGADDSIARALNEAFGVLKDASRRKRYDEQEATKRKGLIGPYRLLHQVAQGGFGTTYKAEHTLAGGYSCIKHCSEVSAHAEDILRQETQAIWNLQHSGLPGMRDLLQLPDKSFALAMSWIEGPTLQQLVEKHGRLDPENVAWIAERLLNTLAHLHRHGVLHGDIKPQNIIVQEESHIVVLVDFGLSMAKPSATSGNKGHTDLFSPPEQMVGKTIVPGSDFYSLGMTMIYALGGGYGAVERKDVPANLPDEMCAFIRSLIVRNVLERPRAAADLFEKFKDARLKSFGRAHSNMKQFTV